MFDVFDRAFAHPGWLLCLAPVAALVIVDALGRWPNASRLRRVGGVAIRGAVLASVVLALADPRWRRRGDVAHVVMVVDRSASIPDDVLASAMARVESLREALPSEVRVGLVFFDRTAEVAVAPGAAWHVPDPLRVRGVEATDLDAGLRLALGVIPRDTAAEIVVLSDGRSTALNSDSGAATAAARDRGIAVHSIALAPDRDDPAVTAVTVASANVRPGSAIEGAVELDGASGITRGKLNITIGDALIAQQAVEIPAAGTLRVPFKHALERAREPGSIALRAELIPNRDDPDLRNNQQATTIVVGTPPRVRIFAGEAHDAEALAGTLAAERMDVRIVDVQDVAPTDTDLSEVDLVVLANAPAAAIAGGKSLQPEFLTEIGRFVDRGGGLVVLGGPQAFDMGGYGYSPLAKLLPVKLDPVDSEVEAGATILIILDRSGSMSAMVGLSRTKMQLADEGAAASIRMLRPFDRAGVMSVTETVRWDVPIQPVEDASALEQRISSIRADGGGIFVFTALEAAQRAMSRTDTPLRHVIVFSDAADSEEKVKGIPFGRGPGPSAEDLAQSMQDAGITTSVIGIGTEDDIDTPFLKSLSQAGGGRFYLTDDATKLRALFVEETERLVDTSLHELAFRPRLERDHPTVAGIDYAGGPELRGYQELEPRPTATVVLSGPAGHPVLTTWRYGLGQVVAWSSDAGPRWAERWLGWNGYARQWTQVARFALRDRAGDETAVAVEHAGDDVRVRIARRDNTGLTIDDSGITARIVGGDLNGPIVVDSIEPGLWEGTVRGAEPGQAYSLEVVGPAGEVLSEHTFAPPPSGERRHRTPDNQRLQALAEQTGGTFEPEALAPETSVVTTDVARLWPLFVLLAMLLLPLDAALRRPTRVM